MLCGSSAPLVASPKNRAGWKACGGLSAPFLSGTEADRAEASGRVEKSCKACSKSSMVLGALTCTCSCYSRKNPWAMCAIADGGNLGSTSCKKKKYSRAVPNMKRKCTRLDPTFLQHFLGTLSKSWISIRSETPFALSAKRNS